MPYTFQTLAGLHATTLKESQVSSLSDTGEVMGTIRTYQKILETFNPSTNKYIRAGGFSPYLPAIWRTPQSLPEIYGSPHGTVLNRPWQYGFGSIARDGTVVTTYDTGYSYLSDVVSVHRYFNAANGGGVQSNLATGAISASIIGQGGHVAYRSFIGGETAQSWIWPANGAPQVLNAVTTSAAGGAPLNFQILPTMMGKAPGGATCIKLDDQVLIESAGRYHQVPSLQGTDKISEHGTAIVSGISGNPTIWHCGSNRLLQDCIVNQDVIGSTLYVSDMNDKGTILCQVDSQTPNAHPVILLPVDLEPDANMAGVVGDFVKSAVSGSTIKHFVSPKKSTELAQDYVILKTTGVTADQITPGHASQVVEWDGGEAMVPVDHLKRRVKRDTAAKTEVKIRIKGGGATVQQMNVWVVWADITSALKPLVISKAATRTSVIWGYDFTHTIQPAGIATSATEIPDLRGAYDSAAKPPNVPAGDTSVYQQGVDLSQGADKRWDNTRRIRQKVINPSNIGFGANHPAKLYTTYLNYPSERLAGNDDATTGDPETNDPYSTSAQLKGTDFPTTSPMNFEGSDGDTFEIRAQWEEFTRLQIGQKWYIISTPYPWRLHFKFKKASGVWEDDSSSLATDNTGF